jgi:muconolactone delta-isomerase
MRFLVEMAFKHAPTPELFALLPAEMEYGATLDKRGIREALYLAADRTGAWQVFRGEDAAAVEKVVRGFPLYGFWNVKISPLAEGAT